jgi:hypothetical protein
MEHIRIMLLALKLGEDSLSRSVENINTYDILKL